jgi:hypothetical protein
VPRLHVAKPGALPGQSAQTKLQVGFAPALSQTKPGPGGCPPQPPPGQEHEHVDVSHWVPPGQPPQSGRHTGWHVVASQVSPGRRATPQSAGQRHVPFTHTNGGEQLHSGPSMRSGIQYW